MLVRHARQLDQRADVMSAIACLPETHAIAGRSCPLGGAMAGPAPTQERAKVPAMAAKLAKPIVYLRALHAVCPGLSHDRI